MKGGVIAVRGARVHNLQNVDVDIPRDQLVVITGMSGSGKSSLAFDTIFAEGQRRYVESLSVYARQFLDQMPKPDVDSVEGLSPAIAIEQRAATKSPRSTVGTVTEIQDHLRLLWARAGEVSCWNCGRRIAAQTVQQMVDRTLELPAGARFTVVAPMVRAQVGDHRVALEQLRRDGFVRIAVDGALVDLGAELPRLDRAQPHSIDVHVDRLAIKEGIRQRLTDSIELALRLAGGLVRILPVEGEPLIFSERFACIVCGITYPEIEPRSFSFNSPQGACPACDGLGVQVAAEPSGRRAAADRRDDGEEEEEEERDDELSRFLAGAPCEECGGARLRKESRSIRIGGRTLPEATALPLGDAHAFFTGLSLPERERAVAGRVLAEVVERLGFLVGVGVEYLTLDRPAGTLSTGEAQRIRLATQIGSSLVGVLYVLDEPSIGLHPRDGERLLAALRRLRDLGSSVLVVEHDEAIIRAADHIIDLGPRAGLQGGRLVAAGSVAEVAASPASITGAYLSGRAAIEVPPRRRPPTGRQIVVRGARAHNLHEVTAAFPVGLFTCVTGVSGSGKSSLVIDTLQRALAQRLHGAKAAAGRHDGLDGAHHVDRIAAVDQGPIGRTPRSNPATYTGLFALVRDLFANLPESRARGYKSGRYSFNVKGGRCEACQGDGIVRIEMHFLPDVYVECEVCRGRRYNRETLEVRYKGASIADVLAMTVGQAAELLGNVPKIKTRLDGLRDVGLAYLTLGQSATTLSGGEAQRLKLSRELGKKGAARTLYILDEPTTGLHFEDIRQLLHILSLLVDEGNTVIVIEHDLDVIKSADWVIDLGPEAGEAGGRLVAAGTPEQVAAVEASHTGRYLRELLSRRAPAAG